MGATFGGSAKIFIRDLFCNCFIMCILFFSVNAHPEYKFILAGNRDEYYDRKSKAAEFWKPDSRILAGRDVGYESGTPGSSTWLGITRDGKIAFLTNFRSPKIKNVEALSRGNIVARFLAGKKPALEYLDALAKNVDAYNGFNVVMGDVNALYYYSSHEKNIIPITTGIYALSNHILDTPWPKVVKGKALFNAALASEVSHTNLFNVLQDREIYPDSELPKTGLSLERERTLSSIFVASPNYGTRSSCVITLDRFGQFDFSERTYNIDQAKCSNNSYAFLINDKD